MPRVEKSRRRAHEADDDVLEEAAPTAMATAEPTGDETVKPTFAPLSAHEQSGKRLEFRRVRRLCTRTADHCLLTLRRNLGTEPYLFSVSAGSNLALPQRSIAKLAEVTQRAVTCVAADPGAAAQADAAEGGVAEALRNGHTEHEARHADEPEV